jgi:hypothetical protein
MIHNGILQLSDELCVSKNFTLTEFLQSDVAKTAIVQTVNRNIDSVQVWLPRAIFVHGLECRMCLGFIANKIHMVSLFNPSHTEINILDNAVVFRDDATFFQQCQDLLLREFAQYPPFNIDDICVFLVMDHHDMSHVLGFIFFDFIEYQKTGIRKPYTGRRL